MLTLEVKISQADGRNREGLVMLEIIVVIMFAVLVLSIHYDQRGGE